MIERDKLADLLVYFDLEPLWQVEEVELTLEEMTELGFEISNKLIVDKVRRSE